MSSCQEFISGPLLARIDIYIEVSHIAYKDLDDRCQLKTSGPFRKRVQIACVRHLKRFKDTKFTLLALHHFPNRAKPSNFV